MHKPKDLSQIRHSSEEIQLEKIKDEIGIGNSDIIDVGVSGLSKK